MAYFTGQLICVVSCLFSLSNGSVLSVVCFHWSTGGLFHWSTDLCCQLCAFTGQRVCVVSCLLSLVNRSVLAAVWSVLSAVWVFFKLVKGVVLSAVCFHWSTALCWQLCGLCCHLFAFTSQRVCVVSRLLSLVNRSVLSAVCFHWPTGGLFQ